VDVLSKVGGLDLCAMCGAFLGAARLRIPAIIDGFISVVAALCAVRLCPTVRDFLIPSHASYEIGYRIAIDELGLAPLFDLGMRLGEGSGCPIAMLMLDAACAVMNDMATFAEPDSTFLVDSITALLLNELFPETHNGEADPDAVNRCRDGLRKLASGAKNAVFVTDYIYSDAMRYDAFTENYRSSLASLDCTLAEVCDVVIELCAGNVIFYKGGLSI